MCRPAPAVRAVDDELHQRQAEDNDQAELSSLRIWLSFNGSETCAACSGAALTRCRGRVSAPSSLLDPVEEARCPMPPSARTHCEASAFVLPVGYSTCIALGRDGAIATSWSMVGASGEIGKHNVETRQAKRACWNNVASSITEAGGPPGAVSVELRIPNRPSALVVARVYQDVRRVDRA
jgi:hypothetical protein